MSNTTGILEVLNVFSVSSNVKRKGVNELDVGVKTLCKLEIEGNLLNSIKNIHPNLQQTKYLKLRNSKFSC